MKQDSLQHLLAKYQEGTISNEELEQLNVLAHRDEVMAAAEGRARTIIRRRTMRTVGLVVAATAVLGAGVWLMTPRQEQPLMAEATAPATIPAQVERTVDADIVPVAAPQNSSPKKMARKTPIQQQQAVQPAAEAPAPQDSTLATPHSMPEAEPIVVCNNQCDADSVISEIWKFLSA